MFPVYDVLVQQTRQPVQLDAFVGEEMVRSNQMAFEQLVRNGIRRLNPDVDSVRGQTPAERGTSWLFGATTWQFGPEPPRRYNSAVMVNPRGEVVERYYKMHPVMFGEYVPFGEAFPGLYELFPMPNGLTPGDRIVAFHCGGLTMCPSICFESTIPHLIRKQVAGLARSGQSPDVLVNLTNDGWFWGSSILDLHLQCAIFRAVELRRPMLVAANTGLSAWIDGNGQLRVRGPRRAEATLLAEVRRDPRSSLYERWGDLPAGLCLLSCLLAGLWSLVVRWKRPTT
jgi:apolipoprotein N-acyltransferase